jgi:hypothetical protein
MVAPGLAVVTVTTVGAVKTPPAGLRLGVDTLKLKGALPTALVVQPVSQAFAFRVKVRFTARVPPEAIVGSLVVGSFPVVV